MKTKMIFFKNFQKYKNIIHGVLEKKDGSVNPFSNPKTEENILNALKKIGFKNYSAEDLIFADQVHSSRVYFCPSGVGGYIKLQTDGLITKARNKILIIKSADCVPILVYNPKQKKVGAIHAGRKGIVKGIIEAALEFFGSDVSSLVVGIGPHIRRCCYYLRKESRKLAQNNEFKAYIQKRNRRFYFDLTKIVIDKFLKAGVKRENIEDCGICTFCQWKRFYSARKREERPEIYPKKDGSFPCFGSFIGLL